MEKQHYLNHFTLLDHLPKIFNMMHILNMMVFGLVVSQPIFFLIGVSSLHKSMRVSSKKVMAQFCRQWIFNRKFLSNVISVSIVLLLIILGYSTENILLTTTLFVLLAIVNRLLSIQKIDLPANQLKHYWR